MTDPRLDPVDDLLAALSVPPLPADFTDRVVTEARRVDRVPTSAPPSTRPRRTRRWTRRSAWTAVLAINLVLASAVAAALGSGAINGPHLIAAARHVVERLSHSGVASSHRSALERPPHARVHALVRPSSPPAYAVRPPAAFPIARPLGARVPVAERPPAFPPPHARFAPHATGLHRFAHPAGLHAGPDRIRPAWRHPGGPRAADRRFARADGRSSVRGGDRFGAERRFGNPAFHTPRFDGPRMGAPRFRDPARFDGGRWGGRGGMRRGWRGPRGRPRGRF